MLKQQLRILTSSGSVLRNIGVLTVVASIGSAGLALSTAQADDFAVNEATTVTNGDVANVIDGGDSLTVKKGASITTGGDATHGVSTSGNENTITNSGTIKTEGDNSRGIFLNALRRGKALNFGKIVTRGSGSSGIYSNGGWAKKNEIQNHGEIEIQGEDSYGIWNLGPAIIINTGKIVTKQNNAVGIWGRHGANITNSGSINTNGENSHGISILNYGNSITNEGKLQTKGDAAHGIHVAGTYGPAGARITNSGSINTSGENSHGISITNNENEIINDIAGIITVSGIAGDGISIDGNSNTITNSGSITAKGFNGDGIWIGSGDGNTITNTGRIVSRQLNAISLDNDVTGTTVNLHTDGFLVGNVDMGTSGGADDSTNVLNIHSNKITSVMWRITGYMENSAPTAVGSVPVFFKTDADNNALHHVATYDPTGLAASVNALGAISGNVSTLIGNRFDGEETSDNGWWMSGLFSGGEYSQNTVMLDYDLRQYSGAIGYDTEISDGIRLGGMVGYGVSALDTGGRWMASHDNEASGLFGALYARNRIDNVFVDLAVSGGSLSHSDKRFVNDNTITASGIATARADYDSWWVAPELGIGVDLEEKLDTWQVTPSARLRYARQSIDGFTETGIKTAGGNAKLANRNIGMVETRLEVAVSKPLERFIHETVESGKITLRAGWQMRRAMGDDAVNVTLLGDSKSVSYKTDNTNSAYLGGAVSMKLDNGMALNLGGEVNVGSGMEHIRATVGLKKAF